MAGRAVAVVGDVVATPGPPSGTITWAVDAAGVQYGGFTYPQLTVGGVAVIHGATCGFTGTDSNTGATTPSSVTLPDPTAPATTLQHGASSVLRNGDTAHDANQNTLTVQASGILTSA
jgi:hypothetical protein